MRWWRRDGSTNGPGVTATWVAVACLLLVTPVGAGEVEDRVDAIKATIVSGPVEEREEALAELRGLTEEHGYACAVAGKLFGKGLGVPRNPDLALFLFNRGMELGDPFAAAHLAASTEDEAKRCDVFNSALKLVAHHNGDPAKAEPLRFVFEGAQWCVGKGLIDEPYEGFGQRMRLAAGLNGNAWFLAEAIAALDVSDPEQAKRQGQFAGRLLEFEASQAHAWTGLHLLAAGQEIEKAIKLIEKASVLESEAACLASGMMRLLGVRGAPDPGSAAKSFACAAKTPELAMAYYYEAVSLALESDLRPTPAFTSAALRAWDAGIFEIWDLAYELEDSRFLEAHPEPLDCKGFCDLSAGLIPHIRAEKARMAMMEAQRIEAKRAARQAAIAEAQQRAYQEQARRERRRAFWSGLLTVLAVGVAVAGEAYGGAYSGAMPPPRPRPVYQAPAAPYSTPQFARRIEVPPPSLPAARRYSFAPEARTGSAAAIAPTGRGGGCRTDLECGYGRFCYKARDVDFTGQCMTPVNEYGTRESDVGYLARCRYPVDCPSGFRCEIPKFRDDGVCVR